jgi:two-component system, LuxR family, sensor kinase FixL
MDSVVIRFEDTGVGIASADSSFKSFQQGTDATGLGLYVSRAILRSCGGNLTFEPRSEGCCFAVTLARVVERQEAINSSDCNERHNIIHRRVCTALDRIS